MSRFREELRVIPPAVRIIAALAFVATTVLLLLFAIPSDRNLSTWPRVAQVAFSTAMGLIVAAYVLLIGYINGDAARRGMNRVLWTLLAIFVPNAIGIILYFVLRDPRLFSLPITPTAHVPLWKGTPVVAGRARQLRDSIS